MRLVEYGSKDGIIEIKPDDQDFGITIRPVADGKFAVYGPEGEWFTRNSKDECIHTLQDAIDAMDFKFESLRPAN